MISRIRFNKIKDWYASYSYPIKTGLVVRIFIESDFTVKIINESTTETIYTNQYKTIQQAKRAARKKLQELGMPLATEIRRKV